MSQMVDAESLRRVFDKEFGAYKVHQIAVKKLAGDASSREYYRILVDSGGKSWVLQKSERFAQDSASSHPFIAAQKIFSAVGIPVPKILSVKPDLGWVLLEDLGDETLQTQKTFLNYQETVKILGVLVLYATPANVKIKSQNLHTAPHWKWAFDFEKLNFEMGFTADNLFSSYLKVPSEKFLKATEFNSRFLESGPRFFCHRDYHSRNVMIQKNLTPVSVIDFQDARMGPITYDIVSLLWDPYVPLSEDWRKDLLQIWEMSLNGHPDAPEAERVKKCFSETDESGYPRHKIELERMIIQRMLKAAGSYASFFVKKGRTDYLPSIAPALNSTLNALMRIQRNYPKAWTPFDDELLTQTEFIVSKLPDSLRS